MAPLHLPEPWQKILARYPEVLGDLPPLDPDEDQNAQRAHVERLQRYIEEKVMSQDKHPREAL
jgi:predicted alternative tryptophan synthase beta-subunit